MSDSTAQRTPVHLWIVAVLALLWNAMGAMDYVMTTTKNEDYMNQFTPEQLEFFYGFPTWLVAFWAVAVWGGVLGALLMLLRKALAAPVLLLSFVAMCVTAVRNFGFTNGAEIMGNTGMIFSIVIFVISFALVLYARAMKSRGVLT